MNPFDYINAINSGKDIMKDPDNPKLMEDGYSPWYSNKSFSYFKDTVLYANEMNRYPSIPKSWQFYFFLNTIQKKKRFSKWAKKDAETKSLQLIKEYYGYSFEKAKEALSVLSVEQLSIIEEKLQKGGK